MDELDKIPSVKLKGDGYYYEITGYSDIVEIVYHDDSMEDKISICTYEAVSVLTEALNIAKQAVELDK